MSYKPRSVLVLELASRFELLGFLKMITHAKQSHRWNHSSAVLGFGGGSLSFGQSFYNLVESHSFHYKPSGIQHSTRRAPSPRHPGIRGLGVKPWRSKLGPG